MLKEDASLVRIQDTKFYSFKPSNPAMINERFLQNLFELWGRPSSIVEASSIVV